MTRYEVERLYKQYGCKDYMLRNLNDLKNIHGVDVTELKGYAELPREQRELFDKTIIRFYNARGLDLRMSLQPKCVHYVYEVFYAMDYNVETVTGTIIVGKDVFIVNSDGKTVGKRLHRHIFEKDVDFNTCKIYSQKRYLRFELKGKDGWYHFTPEGKWY
ncbi:MAG: hypothetical protein NC452_05810 [Eubacterium sp.]|nr:hypothetical protein [Eubacterium sp.]